jgi:hypothetical protein
MDEFDDLLGSPMEKMWHDAIEEADPTGLTAAEVDNMVHTLLARRLVEALQRPDVSPGVMQCALRFLKDNDITALPIPGSAQDLLKRKLGENVPFKLTGTDNE